MAPSLQSRKPVEARHGCSICGIRKLSTDFPLSSNKASSVRVTITCTECIGNLEVPLSSLIDVDEYEAGHALSDPTASPEVDHAQVNEGDEPARHGDETSQLRKKRRRRSDRYSFSARKRRKAEPSPPKPRECRICANEKPVEEFPKGYRRRALMEIPKSCISHLGLRSKLGPVCKECISSSLTSLLDLVGAERLGCLEPSCTSPPWEAKFVQRYLSNEAFTTFSEQLFQFRIVFGPNFVYCANKDCNAGALATRETRGYPNVICASCNQRNCALCRVPWHDGLTCQEYRFKNDGEPIEEDKEALKELIDRGARRCPRCQMAVVKDGGCDHMTCIHCYRSFSWLAAEEIRLGTKRSWLSMTNRQANGPPQNQFPSYYAEACEQDVLDQAAARPTSSTGAATGNPTLFFGNFNFPMATIRVPQTPALG